MTSKLRSRILRTGRKVAGFAALGIGVPLLVLPGPGTPFIVAGLVLLEPEYHWAGKLRTRYQGSAKRVLDAARRRVRR